MQQQSYDTSYQEYNSSGGAGGVVGSSGQAFESSGFGAGGTTQSSYEYSTSAGGGASNLIGGIDSSSSYGGINASSSSLGGSSEFGYGSAVAPMVKVGVIGGGSVVGAAGGGGSSEIQSTAFSTSDGGFNANGAGFGMGESQAVASYGAESSSFMESGSLATGYGMDVDTSALGGGAGSSMAQSSFSAQESSFGMDGSAGGSLGIDTGSGQIVSAQSQQQYSSYPIQKDPNPIMIRKRLDCGIGVYKQKIQIRFLKPPQLPPPGPLIIREIRPPQLPPAPPLIIRQRPPAPAPLPPLILRERPPRPPATITQKVIVKHLPAIPPPPRQVIIERYPVIPPKPRDIIIERWLPYEEQRRKTIYQRAGAVKVYKTQKNQIICYEATRPRVERDFQRLGITITEPRVYVERYGASLLGPAELVQRARINGVVEDINPPILPRAVGAGDFGAVGGMSGGAMMVGSGGFESSSTAGYSASGGFESSSTAGYGASGGFESSSAMGGFEGASAAAITDGSGAAVSAGGYSGASSMSVASNSGMVGGSSMGYEMSGGGEMMAAGSGEFDAAYAGASETGQANSSYRSEYQETHQSGSY